MNIVQELLHYKKNYLKIKMIDIHLYKKICTECDKKIIYSSSILFINCNLEIDRLRQTLMEKFVKITDENKT